MPIRIGMTEIVALAVLLLAALGMVFVLSSRGGGRRRPDVED